MIKITISALCLSVSLLAVSACSDDALQNEIQEFPREGRIGTRDVAGTMAFFDSANSKPFTPKGYNYAQVQEYEWQGVTLSGHSTFNSQYYDPDKTDALLSSLYEAKYNTVRVFLNAFSISDIRGSLNSQYVQNVAHFIKAADEYGLSVIITLDSIPVAYYETQLHDETDIWWWNHQYIFQSEISLEVDFWQTLILNLKQQSVPLDAILAYQIRNKFFFHPDHAPFNNSETIRHPNGETYDLTKEADKIALLEASFLYWSSVVRDAIRVVDRNALVTVGFYAPAPLGTPAATAIERSEFDFIDLHLYPQTASLEEYNEYFALIQNQNKLIIMGEFGILGNDGQDVDDVKTMLIEWKNNAMEKYNLDGWLLWTWDTGQGPALSYPDPDKRIFKALNAG